MVRILIPSIALKCGFENLSYFNRLFRAEDKKFGVTPRQYREEQEKSCSIGGGCQDFAEKNSSPLL